MTIVRFYFLVFILLSGFTVQRERPLVDDTCNSSNNYVDDLSITKDNRIKTYIYNPNEVYLLVCIWLSISYKFAKNEEIKI